MTKRKRTRPVRRYQRGNQKPYFWSLYCFSFFDLRLLITSLVSSNCSCSLSFGHCIAFLSLIYGFWLPLWYLQTALVLFLLVIVLPFFLWFTASGYLFGIFKPLLFSFFWSLYCLSFFDLRLLITSLWRYKRGNQKL
jgi:hypothetical protein